MPSILPVSSVFWLFCLVVVVYGMSSSWYTSSFIIWGGGCLNTLEKSMRDVRLGSIPKQCLLNTATTMTRWTVRSVALLMYTLRLYDDVIKRRRRGLSAVHSGAHFLKKKIETFCSPHPSLIVYFCLLLFSQKNPIRSPSSSFLSLPSYKFNSFFIDSKCRWIEGLAGATDLKQIHSLLDVFCWLNQRLYYSIRRDSSSSSTSGSFFYIV